MINRVLIRIKTVQLLYSYLLVEKPFSLESQPTAPTKEKRYAYNLYLDIIYMMYRISYMISGKKREYPLSDSKFIRKIENDEILKSVINKYSDGSFPFEPCLSEIADEIAHSLIYKEYREENSKGEHNEKLWEDIFKTIIINNPEFVRIAGSLQNYSLSGIERTKEMTEESFRNFYATRDNVDDALINLEKSMHKARELYMRLLLLVVDLTRLRLNQLESNRRKHIRTNEDINPNMRFVENKVPMLLEKNKMFSDYIEKTNISWLEEDKELLEKLLNCILCSEVYKLYMEGKGNDVSSDSELWRELFKQIIFQNEEFLEYLENHSVFWNDDLEITGTFVLKTLKRLEDSATEETAVLPMFKDHEDSIFGASLIADVIKNKELYRRYVETSLTNERWDADRLAFMDVIITMTAISEIINYPKIPLVVSINEYIEIAKSYSTSKSGSFVNGLLASITEKLREEGKIMK